MREEGGRTHGGILVNLAVVYPRQREARSSRWDRAQPTSLIGVSMAAATADSGTRNDRPKRMAGSSPE